MKPLSILAAGALIAAFAPSLQAKCPGDTPRLMLDAGLSVYAQQYELGGDKVTAFDGYDFLGGDLGAKVRIADGLVTGNVSLIGLHGRLAGGRVSLEAGGSTDYMLTGFSLGYYEMAIEREYIEYLFIGGGYMSSERNDSPDLIRYKIPYAEIGYSYSFKTYSPLWIGIELGGRYAIAPKADVKTSFAGQTVEPSQGYGFDIGIPFTWPSSTDTDMSVRLGYERWQYAGSNTINGISLDRGTEERVTLRIGIRFNLFKENN
ncbi:hypothetical protein ACXWTF_12610 [Thiomicrolovo sp. ZZH C-3]